jgi:hypothetical protein
MAERNACLLSNGREAIVNREVGKENCKQIYLSGGKL